VTLQKRVAEAAAQAIHSRAQVLFVLRMYGQDILARPTLLSCNTQIGIVQAMRLDVLVRKVHGKNQELHKQNAQDYAIHVVKVQAHAQRNHARLAPLQLVVEFMKL